MTLDFERAEDVQLDSIASIASVKQDIGHELRGIQDDIDYESLFLNVVGESARDVDVRPELVDAEFEEAIDKTPTFKMTVYDPHWHLLNSGALDEPIDLRIHTGRWYRLDAFEVNDDEITLTFITRNAVYLMRHVGPRSVSRAKMTRAEFIYALVKTVKKVRIPFYCPELHKKQPIAKATSLDSQKKKQKKRAGGLPSHGVTVKNIAADADQRKNLEAVIEVGINMHAPKRALIGAIMCVTQEASARRSATVMSQFGLQVGLFQQRKNAGWPATRDPFKDAPAFYEKFIPIVKANPGADLGSLIDKVQVSGLPSLYNQWRKEAEATVNAWSGKYIGAGTVNSEYAVQYRFEVQKLGTPAPNGAKYETYLAAIYRLAEEVGWRAYWAKDVLHYISEEDLFKSKPRMTFGRGENGVEGVQAGWDQMQDVQTMTLTVRMERWVAPVGTVVYFNEGGALKGKWLVNNIRRSVFDQKGTIILAKPIEELPEPAHELRQRQVTVPGGPAGGAVDDAAGARGIVEQGAKICMATSPHIWVVSDYRPGSTTTTGNVSDHSQNDRFRAARDIAKKGVDAIVGPPSPELDKAVVILGKSFGRKYGSGTSTIVDTWHWHGFRLQVIWRTPAYGGHMGHIHFGARWDSAGSPPNRSLTARRPSSKQPGTNQRGYSFGGVPKN